MGNGFDQIHLLRTVVDFGSFIFVYLRFGSEFNRTNRFNQRYCYCCCCCCYYRFLLDKSCWLTKSIKFPDSQMNSPSNNKGKKTPLFVCNCLEFLFQHGIFSALTFCIGFHAFDVVQLYCHGKCDQQRKNAEILPVYQHMHVVVAAAAHKPNQVLETKLWKLSKFNERSSA